jgi:poly-gamma-glutamate synthesis protein (capsule biosynthesis protein)
MKRAILFLSALLLLLSLAACTKRAFPAPSPVAPERAAAPFPPRPTPAPTPEPTPIVARLTIAGDLVMHESINDEAATGDGTYDYTQLFEDVEGYIQEADLASCCLESTFPGTGQVSGYPMFRSPDILAKDLKDVGFDLVATASNHCLDSFRQGLRHTLDVLDGAGLSHVGTYRSQEERDENNGIQVEYVNGISIAFLDYSYGTNAIPVTGFEYAANIYYIDYLTYFNHPDYDMVAADMKAARALGTDFIAVIVHWGAEYIISAQPAQAEFADFLFSEGADLVLGGHPHVPEPMEKRTVTDAEGRERTGFLCYCLGNLLSSMNDRYTDLTAIVQLTLEKDTVTGEAVIKDAGYIPVIMVDLSDCGVNHADWRFRLWDIHKALNDYGAGDDRGVINKTLYNKLTQGLEDLHAICGEELDLGGAPGGTDNP